MNDWSDLDMTRLTAYLWNESSDEERRGVESWIAEREERGALVAQMRTVLERVAIPTPSNFDLPVLQRTIAQRAGLASGHSPKHAQIDPSTSTRTSTQTRMRRDANAGRFARRFGLPHTATRRWLGIPLFAIIALIALGGIFSVTRAHRRAAQLAIDTRYVTRAGERATVTLRDGTTVVLAPQTTLAIVSGFGDNTRTVHLAGEAYFTVPNASGTPFVVQTEHVTTRVLGTTFAVRRYASERSTLVLVTTGRVASAASGTPMAAAKTASAGDVLHVTDSTTVVTTRRALATYTDWENGRLVFNTVPIADMLVAVGRWYGYQFRLTDSTLASQRVTTAFKVADVNDMFTTLRNVLDVSMTFDGTLVTLTPRVSAHRAKPRTPDVLAPAQQPSTEMGR